MANVAARLMETYQRAALTLLRMRNGGRQVVTVQHVNPAARWVVGQSEIRPG